MRRSLTLYVSQKKNVKTQREFFALCSSTQQLFYSAKPLDAANEMNITLSQRTQINAGERKGLKTSIGHSSVCQLRGQAFDTVFHMIRVMLRRREFEFIPVCRDLFIP